MKMARASQADLDAASEVTSMLGDLEKGYMPTPRGETSLDTEFFDRDDAKDCKRALGMLLDAAAKGSLFRVTFGMLVVCDPRNELLDPDADTIEKHPKIVAALAAHTPREPDGYVVHYSGAMAGPSAGHAGIVSSVCDLETAFSLRGNHSPLRTVRAVYLDGTPTADPAGGAACAG